MIRKFNTSRSKTTSTPYDAIRVSEFMQNQEDIQMFSPQNLDSNKELNFNIIKIKQCKQQTQQIINKMQIVIMEQNMTLQNFQDNNNRLRQKSNLYRLKYQQTLINLRKKQQETQSLQRKLQNVQERYEFLVNDQAQTTQNWLNRQQIYKQKIKQLEEGIHLSQNYRYQTVDNQNKFKHIQQLPEKSYITIKENQSTFV